MSGFATPATNAVSIPVGPPSAPLIAASATGTGRLSEKSLELTFCSQFSAEVAFRHFAPWPNRIVWFGLTQLQESQLGFDAVTSLGGFAIVFQFKASHTVTRKRGRRFKVEHSQMQLLQAAFGHRSRSCFYVFPDIGNINELVEAQSDVVGRSWLVDVASLPDPLPAPLKTRGALPRRDNCHFAYLGNVASGTVQFHSEPFWVNAYKAKEIARRIEFPERLMRTEELIRLLKSMNERAPRESQMSLRNAAIAVLPDHF
jgi:hypothetical protein